MDPRAWAALFVVAAWWASTGVVLRLAWRPNPSRVPLGVLAVAAVAALGGVHVTAATATVSSAFLGFGCALVVWGFHELAFLTGAITGPRQAPCPPEARGWRRFRLAAATLIHHEIALAVTLAVLVARTWGEPNQVATATFAVLWVMRLSAKLNLFLGVRHFTDELVHPRHAYLLTYFRRDRMTPLLPIVLLLGSGAVVGLGTLAWRGAGHGAVASALVATLLGLALLEHLFLAIPLPDAVAWRWLLPDAIRPLRSEVQTDV